MQTTDFIRKKSGGGCGLLLNRLRNTLIQGKYREIFAKTLIFISKIHPNNSICLFLQGIWIGIQQEQRN